MIIVPINHAYLKKINYIYMIHGGFLSHGRSQKNHPSHWTFPVWKRLKPIGFGDPSSSGTSIFWFKLVQAGFFTMAQRQASLERQVEVSFNNY